MCKKLLVEIEYFDPWKVEMNLVNLQDMKLIEFYEDDIRIWKEENVTIYDAEYILNPEYIGWEQDFRIRINGIVVYKWDSKKEKGRVYRRSVKRLRRKLFGKCA
jgi:hypothetical protein